VRALRRAGPPIRRYQTVRPGGVLDHRAEPLCRALRDCM